MTLPPPVFESPSVGAEQRRLLLISPVFPPSTEVGALRWVKLGQLAAARGWRVDVITGEDLPGFRSDPASLQSVGPGTRVWSVPLRPALAERVRAGIWRPLKAVLMGRPSDESAVVPPSVGQASDTFAATMLRAHRAQNHFSSWLAWGRGVTTLARQIAQDHMPEVVISSGPPHMVHEAARRVAATLGLPLVLDLRDPWFIDHAEPADLRSPTWKHRTSAYESACCHAARLIVANTESSADILRGRYPELADRIMVAMNGADPEVRRHAGRGDRFIIAHAGNLYSGRDPRPVFRGVRKFLDAVSVDGHVPDVRVAFVGGQAYERVPLTQMAAEEGIGEVFTSGPPLPRDEALRFMGQAAVLVVLPQDWSVSVPAKVYEYIQFNAWLMVLSRQDDATTRLLQSTSADLLRPDDVDGIARMLGTRYAEWCAGTRPRAINADGRFDRETQGTLLFDRLEQHVLAATGTSVTVGV